MNELQIVNIRLVREPSLYSEKQLDSPQAVLELMAGELAQYDREVFCILNLKSNGQVISMNVVSMGTLDAALVNPREVFKSSILSNASGIIAVHNHPSGNIKPSYEDIRFTVDCSKALATLNISLKDHIIVADGEYYSFRGDNILPKEGDDINE